MRCENRFCIYQHENLCYIAERAYIDGDGRCANYIAIDLSDEQLRKIKHQFLLMYEHGIDLPQPE
ncbi:MAG: hypothetical protein R3Y06_04925 [Faecalibacterium sp.]